MNARTISPARSLELQAADVFKQAKEAAQKGRKGLARMLQEKGELMLASVDRLAATLPDVWRSHQLALAMVDGITSKKVPAHCASLAQRIGQSLQAHAA